jgi:transcription termination/antitermination protein NusA
VAEVIVPDYQLSLAIGKEGQNARLAARLTGWRVDIKSESQLADEEAGIFAAEEDEVEYAEGEWVRNEATGELEWHSADGEVVTAGEWATDQEAALEGEGQGQAGAEADAGALTGSDAAGPAGGAANLEESSGDG